MCCHWYVSPLLAQSTLDSVLPKHGRGLQSKPISRLGRFWYSRRNALSYSPLNLGRLQAFVNLGLLDSSHVITMKQLRDSGAVRPQVGSGVKLLAKVPTSPPAQRAMIGFRDKIVPAVVAQSSRLSSRML